MHPSQRLLVSPPTLLSPAASRPLCSPSVAWPHHHQVTKRDEDSSLMQLKEEFRSYEALRREHDAQIVHIAMEAGLRISPEQWSSLLYGDLVHKSHMQSIIDKVPQSTHVYMLVSIFDFIKSEYQTSTLSSVAAVSRVVCKERSGADNRSAEDCRPC